MAPIDEAGLAVAMAETGGDAAHLAAWLTVALFLLSLLAVWDERRRPGPAGR